LRAAIIICISAGGPYRVTILADIGRDGRGLVCMSQASHHFSRNQRGSTQIPLHYCTVRRAHPNVALSPFYLADFSPVFG